MRRNYVISMIGGLILSNLISCYNPMNDPKAHEKAYKIIEKRLIESHRQDREALEEGRESLIEEFRKKTNLNWMKLIGNKHC